MRADLRVAIDGPAGAGKSAVSRLLAQRHQLVYLDTGAMYRALAFRTLQQGCAPVEGPALNELLARLDIRFDANPVQPRIWVDEEEVTDRIRSPHVSERASQVAALPSVRRRLVALQQERARSGRVIAEGRDVGTVVIPNAEVKIFLAASPEARARRRFEELIDRGEAADYAQTLEAQRLRDERDSGRADSPLRPAPDAVTLDTTTMGLEEVAQRIGQLILQVDERPSSS